GAKVPDVDLVLERTAGCDTRTDLLGRPIMWKLEERCTLARKAPSATPTVKLSDEEKITAARNANPTASKRRSAKLAGVPWTSANRIMSSGPKVVHGPGLDQPVGPGLTAVLV